MRKKKIVYQSDSSISVTGFSKVTKLVLSHLFKTGKYDIVEYCCAKAWQADPEHNRKPWKSFGALPDSMAELNAIAPDDAQKRLIAYGPHNLNKIIYQEKPDVYFGVQDIWGVIFAIDRLWFDKITSVLWVTLDSLPLFKPALEIAPKVKNFWMWSSFAEHEMHRLGFNQVRTVHGPIDTNNFFRLKDADKDGLRRGFNIPLDAFIIGFVFRNQPRKSVPNLIEGYSIFKRMNPQIKNPRLLLHTSWMEGWQIHTLCNEYNIPTKEILTTYICGQCRSYRIQDYQGEGLNCPYCSKAGGMGTTNPGIGVSESQLNEIYNLMNIYVHAFTSGGQELPIEESKCAELVTLITNYSCGEEACEEGAGSLALDWQSYREPDSQFIKATTSPFSIAKQLTKFVNMTPQKQRQMGLQGREWVLSNFSISVIGPLIEQFIDNAPFACPDLEAKPNNELNGQAWLEDTYKGIFGNKIDNQSLEYAEYMNLLNADSQGNLSTES